MQGYIITHRLAASKVEKIMNGELFDYLIASLKPKIRERVLLSSAKSFEEAYIAAEHAGRVFMEYKGITQHSSNGGTYIDHGKGMPQ